MRYNTVDNLIVELRKLRADSDILRLMNVDDHDFLFAAVELYKKQVRVKESNIKIGEIFHTTLTKEVAKQLLFMINPAYEFGTTEEEWEISIRSIRPALKILEYLTY